MPLFFISSIRALKIICVFYGTIRRSDFFLRNAYISCAVCSVVSLKLTIPYCNRDFCVPDILFGLFFTDVVGTLFVDVCIIKRETVNINGCRLEVDNSGLWQFCNSTKFFYYYSIFRIVCIAFSYRIRCPFLCVDNVLPGCIINAPHCPRHGTAGSMLPGRSRKRQTPG